MESRLNEPTTGEIVEEAKRVMSDAWSCAGCDLRTVLRQAADRLESQARAIAGKDVEISTLKEKVESLENDAINYDMNLAEMTARAESAEAERDAYRDNSVKECFNCDHSYCRMTDEPCCDCKNKSNWTRRGLPQEGARK